MNKKIESYIGLAMRELEKESTDSKLQKEYKGYIASLGASIRMSGLIPALAFYSSKENSAKADRSKVLQWILNVLKQTDAYQELDKHTGLFQYALLKKEENARLQKDILDVSIALKLCIRTFELTK